MPGGASKQLACGSCWPGAMRLLAAMCPATLASMSVATPLTAAGAEASGADAVKFLHTSPSQHARARHLVPVCPSHSTPAHAVRLCVPPSGPLALHERQLGVPHQPGAGGGECCVLGQHCHSWGGAVRKRASAATCCMSRLCGTRDHAPCLCPGNARCRSRSPRRVPPFAHPHVPPRCARSRPTCCSTPAGP